MQARYGRRVSVECSVMFGGENTVGEGRILDLSLPGCLLESTQQMSSGEYLQLRLFLSDNLTPLHIPLAAVRWVNGFKAGIEFIRTSQDEQCRLKQFVHRRLGKEQMSCWREGAVGIVPTRA